MVDKDQLLSKMAGVLVVNVHGQFTPLLLKSLFYFPFSRFLKHIALTEQLELVMPQL